MASEKSLEGFVSKFNIVQQEDINCYKRLNKKEKAFWKDGFRKISGRFCLKV